MNNILQLLQLSEEDYNVMFFDFAVQYVETILPHKSKEFLESPLYWNWYKIQFEATNNRFFHTANHRASVQELRSQWKSLHEPFTTIAQPSDYVISNLLKYARTKNKH